MSQTYDDIDWNLPPRIAASAARARMRGRLAAVVSAIGFGLCMTSTVSGDRAVAVSEFSGVLDTGFPLVATVVIVAASVAGIVSLAAGLAGRPLAIVGAVFGASVSCIMTILTYGDVVKLSRDSGGLVERAGGLNLLILGVIVAGVASMVSLSTMVDNVDRRYN